ncbi:spore cortex biosynthesis protein YabQ [Desulfuribacillus alkaliarsenatis]|uniref:Spore cortex biosynthesis protein YabQ n=1 Tax=Desulfuribacillus alkaliarsenatis TaxID=766136 RepID=A0A1E5FYW0_9FIRM|nr:spore cortex biosynthesis protein YabQ [Desulfuribacillus alkaliarsenatis]OEF95765.1 hypothetical protein BHF68_11750 [Desulfuribacillus alkaliarsenatis]
MEFQAQYQLLLYMFLTGAGLAAVFESYRQCHNIYKFHKLLLHLLDFVFWVVAALLVFSILFVKAGGELRFYSLVFLGLGAIFHYYFIRRVTIRVTHTVIRIVTVTVNICKTIIYYLIIKPILLLWYIAKMIWQLILKVWSFLLLMLTTLVGVIGGMLNWTLQRGKKLFKIKK